MIGRRRSWPPPVICVSPCSEEDAEGGKTAEVLLAHTHTNSLHTTPNPHSPSSSAPQDDKYEKMYGRSDTGPGKKFRGRAKVMDNVQGPGAAFNPHHLRQGKPRPNLKSPQQVARMFGDDEEDMGGSRGRGGRSQGGRDDGGRRGGY